jgi:exonuclease SbcC
MRPISLYVEGFGCFRDAQESLDFSDLSLFAISGPTGAGKSSVLDAMTFALYGYVPRLGKQGVSDVISLGRDRMTARLEFAVGTRRFRVGRELRRKRAGAVILEEITQAGAQLLADKVRSVDEEISTLTGLRYETFIQTVLLPQGQFDKFLHSDPAERGKILRELLKLDVYERMRFRAEQESRQHQQQIKLTRERLDQDYGDARPENLEAARLAFDQAAAGEMDARTAAEAAAHQLQEIQTRFAQSSELAEKRHRLQQLDSQRDRVSKDHERLDRARRAAAAIPHLDALDSATARVAAVERDLKASQAQTQSAEAGVQRKTTALKQAEEATRGVPALRKQIQALDELRGVIERGGKVAAEIATSKLAIANAVKDHRTAVANSGKAESAFLDAERQLSEVNKARQVLGHDDKRFRALQQIVADAVRGTELHRQVTAAGRLTTSAAKKAAEAEDATTDATAAVDKCKSAVDRAREQVAKAEAALQHARNANHAAALRPILVEGESCPVCEQVVKHVPRRLRAPELEDQQHALEQAKRTESKAVHALEDARDIRARAAAQAKERRETAAERETAVEDLEKDIAKTSKKVARALALSIPAEILPADVFEAISAEAEKCARLKQKFDEAGERLNESGRVLQEAKHRREQASADVGRLASRVGELRIGLKVLEDEESEIRSRIAAVTTASDPASERQELAKRITDLETSERQARERSEEAQRFLERAKATERGLEQGVSDARTHAEGAREKSATALQEAGFPDAAHTRAAALGGDVQRQLETSIQTYEVERHQVDGRIGELEKTLAGRLVTEDEHAGAQLRSQAATKAHHAAMDILTRSRQNMERLAIQVERATALRTELMALESRSVLSEQLARDLKNDAFQRYLLEEAFCGLVEGASARMKEWTNRYTLQWDDGAFYAIDHDNGGERRRAETLSGGETFLASLCLAMQLSEEVLRTAGAVEIDSLFIDEGFGSLDVESLEVVTEAIESLRTGGRMVGIITHIRDLTERLPGCIDIEKGQGQSRWHLARVG